MEILPNTLQWSDQYRVAPLKSSSRLQGDRISLPQSALEALLAAAPVVNVSSDTSRAVSSSFDPFNPHTFAAENEARNRVAEQQQQLPHPLTFKLVNPLNNRVAYCGVREFSAEESEIGLSAVLRDALGIKPSNSSPSREVSPNESVQATSQTPDQQKVTVHAKQLPKGTYVRLRPLEAGYDPEDWKSLLERYLRDNFTTLTNGEILSVKTRQRESFQFLVDKFEPAGDAICIIDTDLEVQIEALNEEQARETLRQKLAKKQHQPGTPDGSSPGGEISFGAKESGQVVQGEYVDYKISPWKWSGQDVLIDLEIPQDHAEVDLLISPLSSKQRAKPRPDDHIWSDFTSNQSKSILLAGSHPAFESTEALYISVHAYPSEGAPLPLPIPFVLRARLPEADISSVKADYRQDPAPDEVICKNCHQSIPKQTLPLHEVFCYRNNVACADCHRVFLRSSPYWKSHWHCPDDSAQGDTTSSQTKHNTIFHPATNLACPDCEAQSSSLPALAAHRTSTCPGKEILCQFCHLIVPQQGSDDPSFTDPEVLMSGLTPHELSDGNRTTECHLCSRIVRLRDMKAHLMLHDRDRLLRPKPRICRNRLCGRTIQETQIKEATERLGLCSECFGPLYVTSYDPEGKALKRRTERRLLQQVMAGCGKNWCHNTEVCRTGRKNATGEDQIITAKDALPTVRKLLEIPGGIGPLFFCVDEPSQRRKELAERLAESQEYEVEWWVKGLEETRAGAGDTPEDSSRRAREWLETRAPKVGESVR